MLSQAYILSYPAHVRKLVLADTVASTQEVNIALARMRAAVPPETQAILEKWERESLYNGRDRYLDEYHAACDVAYAPVM